MLSVKRNIIFFVIAILWFITLILFQFTFPGIFFQALFHEIIPGNDMVSIILLAIVSILIISSFFFIRRSRYFVLVLGLFIALIPVSGSLWFARDNWRKSRMIEIQHVLEELKLKNKLPKSLSARPRLEHLLTAPFGIDRIWYELEGKNYVIRSYSVPLGPFELYSSKRSEWYYEE